jgi:hypothetical protein
MIFNVAVVLVDAEDERTNATHQIVAADQAQAVERALERQLPRAAQPEDVLFIYCESASAPTHEHPPHGLTEADATEGKAWIQEQMKLIPRPKRK